jgi:hypothetical protein
MFWRGLLFGALMAVMVPHAGPARAEPPPAEPLDAHVVDVAPYPTVLIDLVVPWQFATADIDPAMIELEDATIESVARVDAVTNVVGLVIDDGPDVPTEVVYSAQAASIELVRNLGDGTAIALSTPSGMQTTPTTDRGANIARIAGITAGAPDVVPLHRLVLDAAERLAATRTWPERHLVLVLGRPINERPTLRALADIAGRADLRIHVIADPGIDTGDAADLAENTGGVASRGKAMLAEVDQVTAAIANRVRVRATVTDPGPHELVLTLDGARFAAEIDVSPSPITPTATTSTGTVATQAAPATTPTGTVATQVAPTVTDTAATPTVRAVSAPGSDRAVSELWLAVVVVVALLSALGWWLWSSGRRRARSRPPARAPRSRPATPVVQPVSSLPKAHVAARSVSPEPEPENDVVAPDEEAAASAASGAPAGERRRPAGRPRRATPHRRPPTDAPPPAEPSPQDPADSSDWLVVGRLRLSKSAGEVFSGSRRISLTRSEFAVLELLMTRGGHGVTQDAIRAAAASTNGNGEEPLDLDDLLAELRRKTGLRGRGRGVRSERAQVYFFSE